LKPKRQTVHPNGATPATMPSERCASVVGLG
jgi:hypothetical protein